MWRPALEVAGVGHEDPYSMRHTCASWLIQAGVPVWEVVKILGHSSTRMFGVYAHLDRKKHDRVRDAWASDSATAAARAAHAGNGKSPHPAGWGL